jgi:hypothetical protein
MGLKNVEYIDNHVVKKESRDKRQREQQSLLSCLVLFLTWVFESASVLKLLQL